MSNNNSSGYNLAAGLQSWRYQSNHNHMIELQETGRVVADNEGVEVAFFGSSAFRITTPEGLSIMIDPWRNHPSGKWDWYRSEFPLTEVDIGISTHAHFDHDALDRLDSSVNLDRFIGRYEFADAGIVGIADKHVCESGHSLYDWTYMSRVLSGVDPRPPNNPRSFDNSLIVVEAAGLKFLHWGDNRHNPPEQVWERLQDIDVVFLPIDASAHILSYEQADEIVERLRAKVVIPHHYFIWDLMQRGSTLQTAQQWCQRHDCDHLEQATTVLRADAIANWQSKTKVLHFGDNVAFSKPGTAVVQDFG